MIWVLILSLLMNKGIADAACVFPAELVGIWSSSDGSQLVVTRDEVNDYRINLTVKMRTTSFKCHDLYQGKYILKSSATFLFNTFEFDAYLCVDFYKISSTQFTYHLASVVDPSLNERVITRFAADIPALAEICNRPEPYEDETLIALNKIEFNFCYPFCLLLKLSSCERHESFPGINTKF
ncbi:hypothetical protein ACJMK2_030850 [Sinanodonta woodiana]|uniref:Uncharacterized protein n=1 Tax=Sinanodonta woodiana TaxID=1069815 RepID=A0ABD3WX14_SINWO